MVKYVNEDKPIIFKNETDSDFNVCVGIVFRKSGVYEISINDKTTTVSKISERKTGKWIVHYECPKCGEITKDFMEYCPFCNADMRGEEE